MSEFLFLYRGGERPDPSPAQMQAEMQRWMTWLAGLREAGHVKDTGQPVDRSGKLVRGKQKTITDGPYPEKDVVGGYTVVEAKDIAHACELSMGCPILEFNGVVEIRPVMKM